MNNDEIKKLEEEIITFARGILPKSKQDIVIQSDTDLKNELYLDSFNFAELFFYIEEVYNVNLIGRRVEKYTPHGLALEVAKYV